MDTETRIPNAEKWTIDRVRPILRAILKGVQEDENNYFIGKALAAQGLYSDIWAYWKRIFADNNDIAETMMQIDTYYESRLMEAALTRKVSPAVAMMILKTKYGYSDKPAKTNAAPQPNNAVADADEQPDPEQRTHTPAIIKLSGGRMVYSDGNPLVTTYYKAQAVSGPGTVTTLGDLWGMVKADRLKDEKPN